MFAWVVNLYSVPIRFTQRLPNILRANRADGFSNSLEGRRTLIAARACFSGVLLSQAVVWWDGESSRSLFKSIGINLGRDARVAWDEANIPAECGVHTGVIRHFAWMASIAANGRVGPERRAGPDGPPLDARGPHEKRGTRKRLPTPSARLYQEMPSALSRRKMRIVSGTALAAGS